MYSIIRYYNKDKRLMYMNYSKEEKIKDTVERALYSASYRHYYKREFRYYDYTTVKTKFLQRTYFVYYLNLFRPRHNKTLVFDEPVDIVLTPLEFTDLIEIEEDTIDRHKELWEQKDKKREERNK